MYAPLIHSFYDSATHTATYIVSDQATHCAAIIDSVLDFDPRSGRISHASADQIIEYARLNGLTISWLLETHAHVDHLSAAAYLQEKLGGRIGIGQQICTVQTVFKNIFNIEDIYTDGSNFDHLFQDGEIFNIGQLNVHVLHTPGHTPACLTYVIDQDAFTGDTLFMPDYGTASCDFPGGDAATLYQSIQKILSLPLNTRLHLCHGYPPTTIKVPRWQSTVAEQRKNNIHIHDGITQPAFVNLRTAKDRTLPMPALILPAIQVNLRAGQLPPAEANGVCYLKLPLDVF